MARTARVNEQVDVTEDGPVKGLQITLRDRIDFLLHERMATNRTLAIDDHRAGQDVRAFNRDADRHCIPGSATACCADRAGSRCPRGYPSHR